MRRIFFILPFMLSAVLCSHAQSQQDSLVQTLKAVDIRAERNTLSRLPQSQNGYNWAGKKNEVIQVQNLDANIAEKTPRQVFAKVPGVFVYDMDGSGNQTNISTRGLDPHRGWEFNIRADGIITNSDMYGYPASHFSLPLEAVGKIELVRGTGALQYGAQFGGMLNYAIKQPDTTRRIAAELSQSVGAFGLLSTYAAAGGKVGSLEYYLFYSKRQSDGYRRNGDSDYDGQGAILKWHVSKSLVLRGELLRSNYLYHMPGPLTDAMFEADPRQSTRSRNYYSPEIWVPSFTAFWKTGAHSSLTASVSNLTGERRSVMFDRTANIKDTIVAATLQYNPRQVDLDVFDSWSGELRWMGRYKLGKQYSTFSAGVQRMHNDLRRRQQGKGTEGSDYDMTIVPDSWRRDLYLKSRNWALYVENKFQLTQNWSVSPGCRIEWGGSDLSGKTVYYNEADLPNTIEHQFPLLGISSEYRIGEYQTLYTGWSQSYRPVIFKDIIPGSIYEQSDKNLKDAFGSNAELGWRGQGGGFHWDVNVFSLEYNYRLGSLARYDEVLDTFVLFRTNIGNSLTLGAEMFAEYKWQIAPKLSASIFSATAYFHARYLGDSLRVGANKNQSLRGKHLESVPDWISRNGLTIKWGQLSCSGLYSYTGASFSDPLNTEIPSANGAVGPAPAYGIWDFNLTYRINKCILRWSWSNLADRQYYTKRPTFYPGPGIWPSDGRSWSLSATVYL